MDMLVFFAIILIMVVPWLLAFACCALFYRKVIEWIRSPADCYLRKAAMFMAILHLACWLQAYTVESRTFVGSALGAFEHAKQFASENEAEAQQNGMRSVVVLREKPAIWYKCFSPLPFVFLCYEGYSFGPLWGEGKHYVGIFSGLKMINVLEYGSWNS
jgi:hypothetical protein